jgi:alpha-L-fucosidase
VSTSWSTLNPQDLINGNGLDIHNAAGVHGNAGNAVGMWHAANGTSPVVVDDQYVILSFDVATTLTELYIWNHNQSGLTGRGVATFKILISSTPSDNDFVQVGGVRNLSQASGNPTEAAQTLSLGTQTNVRRVKIDIDTTHNGSSNDYVGLSEIGFEGSPPPPPIVHIIESDGSTVVTEGGATDSYDVVLIQQPIAAATVEVLVIPQSPRLQINGTAAGTPVTLTFTDATWDTAQPVTVSAVNDARLSYASDVSIRHISASVSDPAFHGISVAEVAVDIADNDQCELWGFQQMDFDQNCVVELNDLAHFASQWLLTTQQGHPDAIDIRMDWWKDARFGMFIHWGPVSQLETEIGWSRGSTWPIATYDSQYLTFNPDQFDADKWARVAKAAGMKYMVLTAKHHDGFCLWDTQYTDYNIMNSPFGRDIVKELSEACKRHGLRFCTYYSIIDWYHPDYMPYDHGGPGYALPPEDLPADFERYVTYMKNQLQEIVDKYGPQGLFWFDGYWVNTWTVQHGDDLEDYCRNLQPDVILNDRVGKRAPTDGDYDTPEQTIGGFNLDHPWETCMTVGTQWSWKPNDTLKPASQGIQTLIKSVGGDGNLLYNIGPMPNGEIEQRQIDILVEMGQWIELYGESIYGTRGGPYKEGASWGGTSTRKGNMIYLHILSWPTGNSFTLPALSKTILSTSLMTGGNADVVQSPSGVTITVDPVYHHEFDTIIKLELDGPAIEIDPIGT